MKRILAFVALSLFLSGLSDRALAQSLGNAGTLLGTVTDPSGAPLPNATVTILNRITNYKQSTVTNTAGAFRLTNVPPNPYHMEVTAPNFANYQQDVDVRSTVPIET